MTLRLKIEKGPDSGKQSTYGIPVIRIGRGPSNDLVLKDGLISQFHGELVRREWGYVYRDLRSKHGTLVKVNHVTVNLHDHDRNQEVTVVDGAELILGESTLKVNLIDSIDLKLSSPTSIMEDTLPGMSKQDSLDEQLATSSKESIEKFSERISENDPRLLSIFKLSRNLNKTSDLDEILSLLVDATFEAFPSANFFAISLLPEDASDHEYEKMEALVARDRTPLSEGSPRPLLSKSLLAQVAESRESILFVRDDTGANLSDSIINARIMACLAAPLIGQKRLLGVMQTDTRGLGGLFGPEDLDLFTVVASYAAFAIEGLQLSERIYEMFEGIVRASVTAVDARDPSTSGHSLRVCQCYMLMADIMNEIDHGPYANNFFNKEEMRELRYAALLHDIGKIGVRESILVKAKRLYPDVLDTIKTRFETIKAWETLSLNRSLSESLLKDKAPLTQTALDQLEAHATAIKEQLDQQMNFILKANGNPFNDEETISKLEEIGNRTYTDSSGNRLPFLKEDELASLQIPRGTLTQEEWQDIKSHSALSRDYLNQIPWNDDLKRIPMIAGWHHEKLDGSGYPDGIQGDEIPLTVRMLTICDIYDSLTAADRPYRNALSPAKAGEILKFEAEKGQLDKELVNFFVCNVIPRWEKNKETLINNS